MIVPHQRQHFVTAGRIVLENAAKFPAQLPVAGDLRLQVCQPERCPPNEQHRQKEQCVAGLTAMTDRYPMDVEQDGMAPMVMKLNAANLYDYVTESGIHRRS